MTKSRKPTPEMLERRESTVELLLKKGVFDKKDIAHVLGLPESDVRKLTNSILAKWCAEKQEKKDDKPRWIHRLLSRWR